MTGVNEWYANPYFDGRGGYLPYGPMPPYRGPFPYRAPVPGPYRDLMGPYDMRQSPYGPAWTPYATGASPYGTAANPHAVRGNSYNSMPNPYGGTGPSLYGVTQYPYSEMQYPHGTDAAVPDVSNEYRSSTSASGGSLSNMDDTASWDTFAWGTSDLQHGPENVVMRPPYAQFLRWQAAHPNEVIVHGPRTEKCVALTFDNGPDPLLTPRILQLLANHQVPATFCCIGSRVRQNANLLRRIVDNGHVIANHSLTHPDFCKITDAQAQLQLNETSLLIDDAIGRKPALFRPPYGSLSDPVIACAQKRGYHVLLWDVDSLDWTHPGGLQLAANLLAHTRPGSIIAMHSADEGHLNADHLQVLRYFITTLQEQKYTFQTVPDLVGVPGYQA